MANIAFDSSSISAGSVTNSKTISHTIGAGSNTILLVYTWNNQTSDITTGVTYNGASMTSIAGAFYSGLGGYIKVYYLLNPTAGANNIVASYSSSRYNRVAGVSYSGVKQSAQPDAFTTKNNGTGTTESASVTTVADNAWVLAAVSMGDGGTPSAGSGTTMRVNDGAGDSNAWFDSGSAVSPAGSKTLNFVSSASNRWAEVILSIAPFSSSIKTINGLARASVKTINGLAIASVKSFNGLS